jgi:hypothetical protein
MDNPADHGDEVWTVGEAAAYLNAGPVNFGITPKRVRFMAKDPDRRIRAVSGGAQVGGRRTWYRVLASTVRAERASMLKAAGYEDPEWPRPEGAG